MRNILAAVLWVIPFGVLAGNADTTIANKDIIKQGWNVGPIPFVAYDSDLGFEYGGVVNFFYYGDGSRYPQYLHSIYAEVSRYTRGSGVYRLSYDSKFLIPGIRFTTDITYSPNLAADFYGFNGSESIYHKSWTETSSPDYRSRVFYKMNNDMFRVFTDFQGSFNAAPEFRWVLGAAFYRFNVGNVKLSRLDVPESSYGADKTLYSKYVDWGLVGQNEKHGGSHFTVKGGVTFDTRDNEPNPMSGIWTDLLAQYATPSLQNGGAGHLKITAAFRQYFTLIEDDLSFAYRVLFQNVVAGSSPFYMLPLITTTSLRRSYFDGLGGSQTLRGVLRNRIVGKGIAFANAELRYKFWRFRFLNQNVYCAINTFFDAGMITQKVDMNLSEVPVAVRNEYFGDGKQRPHYSLGVGGKVVLNQNFVISGELGKALRKQDGDVGIYIGANFLF